MKNVSFIVLLLMFGILISCETEIPFNGKITEPMLVVNCIPFTDTVIQADITASRFFLSNESEFKVVENATVDLYINGAFKEKMMEYGQGIYRSHYIPLEGDVVKLNVSAAGYESVWAESTVPMRLAEFQVDSTINRTTTDYIVYNYGYNDAGYDTVGVRYSNIHDFKLIFTDVAGESNYYRLVVKETTIAGEYSMPRYLDNFDDIVFGTKKENMDGVFSESPYDRYNIFSDELIDGKTHTITIPIAQSYETFYDRADTTTYGKTVNFNLQSISKGYYLYLKSLKALEIASPFMSEPVQIYTNVNGGLGIVGAGANQQRFFDLSK